MAYIAIDFDGTVVRHEYPNLGKDIPDAVEVLKKLVKNNHKLILSTMRPNMIVNDQNQLLVAIDWFSERDIPLYGINHNPTQDVWTDSPKVYANLYIGDDALGCPLLVDVDMADHENLKSRGLPYVNWKAVDEYLELHDYYSDDE